MEKNRIPVLDYRIEDCENCDGLTMIYDHLVLHTDLGEVHLSGEVCMNACDPLLVSLTVHT